MKNLIKLLFLTGILFTGCYPEEHIQRLTELERRVSSIEYRQKEVLKVLNTIEEEIILLTAYRDDIDLRAEIDRIKIQIRDLQEGYDDLFDNDETLLKMINRLIERLKAVENELNKYIME